MHQHGGHSPKFLDERDILGEVRSGVLRAGGIAEDDARRTSCRYTPIPARQLADTHILLQPPVAPDTFRQLHFDIS